MLILLIIFNCLSLHTPPESIRGGYYPLYPPEYATGWKGGREGREGGGVVGRPHFEGASLSSRFFSKLSKIQSNVLDPDPGVKTGSGSREILKPDPDPSEITRSDRIRIRNPADITLLSLSFSELERLTRFPALRLEYLYLYKDAPDTIELSLFPTPFLIYRHRTTHIQRAQKIFSSVQKFSELR